MKNSIKHFLCLGFLFVSFFSHSQEMEKKGFAVSVNKKVENATMTKDEFRQATFDIYSYLPVLAGQAKLKGFSVKYPGQKEIAIEGNKLSEAAIRGLAQLKSGDQIVIYNMKSDSYFKIDVLKPMIVTLQ
jgi:hypothetical protein